MSQSQVAGYFLDGARGAVFTLVRRPRTYSRGCILVVPPFAEEMNKCRRMITELAIGLAGVGIATVVPDLFGTGDSSGDFSEADLSIWSRDLAVVAEWCEKYVCQPSGLLAIRFGCGLTLAALDEGMPPVAVSVFWQPVLDGNRYLAQFMRQRAAATRLMKGRTETHEDVNEQLEAMQVIEVAGYSISSRLVSQLRSLTPPEKLPEQLGQIYWMEVVRQAPGSLRMRGEPPAPGAPVQGGQVKVETFAGQPFWASTEVVVLPDMVGRTISAFSAP